MCPDLTHADSGQQTHWHWCGQVGLLCQRLPLPGNFKWLWLEVKPNHNILTAMIWANFSTRLWRRCMLVSRVIEDPTEHFRICFRDKVTNSFCYIIAWEDIQICVWTHLWEFKGRIWALWIGWRSLSSYPRYDGGLQECWWYKGT